MERSSLAWAGRQNLMNRAERPVNAWDLGLDRLWQTMEHDVGAQGIVTVERAADVLAAFSVAGGGSLGVTEIANQLSLSKAVVHRILASLRTRGFVEVDENTRRYLLGPSALTVGLSFLNAIDIREKARPVLQDLSTRTQETATLSVRRDQSRVYIDQITPPREVKMIVELGYLYPLHAGSSSKALLAYLADDEISEILSQELAPLTDKTITNPDRLWEELRAIRRNGWAASVGERQSGAASVAAPILNHENIPVAVVSICGPEDRFLRTIDVISRTLLKQTRELSRQLGWSGP